MKRGDNLFQGMYGLDSLSMFLIVIAAICNLISLVRPVGIYGYLGLVGYLPLMICLLRGISRNHERREQENQFFLDILRPMTDGIDRMAEEKEQKKMFKFYFCPACRQKIRVPKGKGKVEITCPKCGTRFIKKT